MNQRRAWASVLGALALTGCTAAGAAVSGGQQPGERPIPGTVTFTTAGQRPVSVRAGTSGEFSVWLPPGRYRVAGRSPDLETVTASGKTVEDSYLEPWSVTVTARHTTATQVVFIVP